MIQYSDTIPPYATKAARAELLNALQSKDICAEPKTNAVKKNVVINTIKYQSNFFDFNSANATSLMSQSSAKPFAIGNIGQIFSQAKQAKQARFFANTNIANNPAANSKLKTY